MSLASSQPAAPTVAKVWRPSPLSKVFAFTPLWVLIITYFTAPTYFGPMISRYQEHIGFLLGAAMLAIEMSWMLIGAYLLWGARSLLTEALVYVVFTIPTTIAVILSPAIVLILQNLG